MSIKVDVMRTKAYDVAAVLLDGEAEEGRLIGSIVDMLEIVEAYTGRDGVIQFGLTRRARADLVRALDHYHSFLAMKYAPLPHRPETEP